MDCFQMVVGFKMLIDHEFLLLFLLVSNVATYLRSKKLEGVHVFFEMDPYDTYCRSSSLI